MGKYTIYTISGDNMDQAGTLREKMAHPNKKHIEKKSGQTLTDRHRATGIAVASGKGGVGKTNIVSNLASIISRKGKRVLVFDADMGLGNIHILLGLVPKYNLVHVLSGEMTLKDVLIDGPDGIKILPTSPGGKRYHDLTNEEKLVLTAELESLEAEFDYILFDIGAGISTNVLYFCTVAQEIVIISTPEPTSFADAYAIMKVLKNEYARNKFRLIVNMVKNETEGVTVFNKLSRVADRFNLDISINFAGYIVKDENVAKSVMKQQLFCNANPDGHASKCVKAIAEEILTIEKADQINWQKAFNI